MTTPKKQTKPMEGIIDLANSPSPSSSLRITRAKGSVMLESGEKTPIKCTQPTKNKQVKRKFVDDSSASSSSGTDPEDDNLLVTPNLLPPSSWITHPKTGAVYENVTHELYEQAKEEVRDWFGWEVPIAQHKKFMAPNETFVVFSRRDDAMDRYSYRSNPGEFARIGFFKKVADPKKKAEV